jgi:hypothetical protein
MKRGGPTGKVMPAAGTFRPSPFALPPLRAMVAIAAWQMCASALAADPEENALQLADQAPAVVAQASNWRSFVEGAYGGDTQRDGEPVQQDRRASLDVHYDNSFAPGWRAVLADRLDATWPAQSPGQYGINTIKDAYLGWQPRPDAIFDAGRINVHEGVAMGYNPTDYFRVGAVRSIVSVDPLSLKENRQGSMMLRGQSLWDSGSVTALYSPKLSDEPNSNGYNPDLGATNNQDRWLIAVSQKLIAGVSPQLLLYKEADLPVQLGLNLTGLVNDAMVVYAEWSGGRSPSLLSQALRQYALPHADDTGFRDRLSLGTTYTTTDNLSLTAELQYNGAGMERSGWDALYRQSPIAYGIYRNWLLFVRDPPTTRAVFFYAKWQDALVNHLDLSAMESVDAVDYSRLSWLEARYHFDHYEVALQWQRFSGRPLSDYGAAPQIQSWLALLRYYL